MRELYQSFKWAIAIVLTALVLISLVSCRTEYIPIESTHTEHHWHTDSVKQTDSVYHEIQTTIMQLDSAEMAKYGIRLKNAERAWLVQKKELERKMEQLMKMSAIADTVRDTIQVPVPVEKKLTKWEQTKVDWGGWAILVIIIVIVYLVIYPRWRLHKGRS